MEQVHSTYRVQLGPDLGFPQLRARVPYLSRLGVSHVYLSPIQRPRSGSPHGYDIVDPTEINPELGGTEEWQALVAELRRHRMGAILDIVPNHMATGSENPFWEDVLQHGPSSRFAGWFDIDWGPRDARRPYRVLLPVLGDRLARVIDSGDLVLAYDAGRLRIRYYDQSFPLDPGTLPLLLELDLTELGTRAGPGARGSVQELRQVIARLRSLPSRQRRDPRAGAERAAAADAALQHLARLTASAPLIRDHLRRALTAHNPVSGDPRLLRRLISAQPYRLAYWRRAAREINYRRFFTISHLVALRQEDPGVFEATHRLPLEWVENGLVDGLRIDHVDGLLDPGGYLARLREEVDRRLPVRARPLFALFVEKILARDEELPESWPIWGTTGYDFMAEAEDIFIDAEGLREIERTYASFSGRVGGFDEEARRCKRLVLEGPLAAETRRLSRMLETLANGAGAPFDRARLSDAIAETIACLRVYRTYLPPGEAQHRPSDRRRLQEAIERSRDRPHASRTALRVLENALIPQRQERPDGGGVRSSFVQRFQQVCVAAAAKGVEDRAFYTHVPLASRNEVGGDPGAPPAQADAELHASNLRRAQRWPRAMLAATTHDTKRSADLRARLDVLSEIPDAWERVIRRWHRWNRRHRTRVTGRYAPDRNTEYLLYQTLVGVWPLAPAPSGSAAAIEPDAELRRRVREYTIKAAREAKVQTSWVSPRTDFEAALGGFVAAILSRSNDGFLADLDVFARRVTRIGVWNSLARTLVQLASPGTPDIYQGDELWNYSLVDPDNRRPVDYEERRALLEQIDVAAEQEPDPGTLRALVESPLDGRLKLWILQRLLHLRRSSPKLFQAGSYAPLWSSGARARHVFAFARRLRGERVVAIVPRLCAGLAGVDGGSPLGADAWGDTELVVGPELSAPRWRCALSGLPVEPREGRPDRLPLAAALRALPVALLRPLSDPPDPGRP